LILRQFFGYWKTFFNHVHTPHTHMKLSLEITLTFIMISVFNPIGWFEYIKNGHKPQELDCNSFSFVYQKFDYKNYTKKTIILEVSNISLKFFEMEKLYFLNLLSKSYNFFNGKAFTPISLPFSFTSKNYLSFVVKLQNEA